MNETTKQEAATAEAGRVDPVVRPVITAYVDYCGVSDGRFNGLTDEELKSGAVFAGYDKFRAGWDSALSIIDNEINRLCTAIDHGGNKYERAASVADLSSTIRKLMA